MARFTEVDLGHLFRMMLRGIEALEAIAEQLAEINNTLQERLPEAPDPDREPDPEDWGEPGQDSGYRGPNPF